MKATETIKVFPEAAKLIGNLLTRWELMTNDFKSVFDEQERDFFQAMHDLVRAVDDGRFYVEPGVSESDRDILQTLASALKKFAPEAVEIILEKVRQEQKGYEEFVAFLRS